jgi:signal transduction histidine kinase
MGLQQFGAAASLIALGATFIGTTLLLLFNPGSRAVRWYAAFNVTLMLWLGLQGVSLLTDRVPHSLPALRFAVHMLPAMFLATSIAHAQLRAWVHVAPILLGLLLFPLMETLDWRVAQVWHILAWSAAAGIYTVRAFQGRGRGARRGRLVVGERSGSRSERVLELVLSGFVPIGVIGAILAQGTFVIVVLPLLTIVIMLLIFSGVVFHRYYDIEVRAARTGELATAAAEHDRLALLGELSATIAHEVRNPLTGIRSLTQMMAEPDADEQKRVHYATVILGEVTRLDRIVGNLTDLAKRSSRDGALKADAALSTLFDDLRLLVDARARRSAVTVAVDGTDSVVHESREALAQALLNLLLNAIAHAPAGTTVRLSAERNGSAYIVTVSDEGPGVPAEERARIFEPFHTRGGTGLGLTVVKRLADEHGWTIGVEDAPGGGARFSLVLPAAEPA